MKSPKTLALRWSAVFVLLLGVALLIVFLAPSALTPALACVATGDGQVLTASDFSQLPLAVLDDARQVAAEFYPKDTTKQNDLLGQLCGMYLAAKDVDFVLIFNPGGWGWAQTSDIPGWESILFGIRDTLGSYGYRSLLIDYKRTHYGFDGIVGETEELLGVQPEKAKELAARVDFLTRNIPGLRVILTGESNGATIADKALRLLEDNPNVYAIETGPPVWHLSLEFARSLVIKNNGEQSDTFSSGNIVLIIRSNLESAFGIYRGAQGNILLYVGAPGHYYSWDYVAVRTEVVNFLTENFARASG